MSHLPEWATRRFTNSTGPTDADKLAWIGEIVEEWFRGSHGEVSFLHAAEAIRAIVGLRSAAPVSEDDVFERLPDEGSLPQYRLRPSAAPERSRGYCPNTLEPAHECACIECDPAPENRADFWPAAPVEPSEPMETFQDVGESYRQQLGIDGTAGDAQDVRHEVVEVDRVPGCCVVCGLSTKARIHGAAPVEPSGDVIKCERCGQQSRSISRGCSNCGWGKRYPCQFIPVEPSEEPDAPRLGASQEHREEVGAVLRRCEHDDFPIRDEAKGCPRCNRPAPRLLLGWTVPDHVSYWWTSDTRVQLVCGDVEWAHGVRNPRELRATRYDREHVEDWLKRHAHGHVVEHQPAHDNCVPECVEDQSDSLEQLYPNYRDPEFPGMAEEADFSGGEADTANDVRDAATRTARISADMNRRLT